MNKKVICLIAVFITLLILFLNSCNTTDNWKTIEIKNYGNIKVPENWKSCTVDEFLYLSLDENGDSKNILVQYSNDARVNPYFDQIEESVWLEDENYSNSTGIIKTEVHYKDGSKAEMFKLYFTFAGPNGFKSAEFFCLDTSVSENTLKKIAKSYIMNAEDTKDRKTGDGSAS